MKLLKVLAPLAATLLLVTTHVHGFGGSIAVGMARLNDQTEQLDVSFTATATLASDEFNVQEQIYYRPGRLREEMAVSGQDMVTIQRHDLGKMWVIMPQGFYMETPIDEASEQTKSFDLIEHKQVGSESVNGMDTQKHRTVWETDDGQFSGNSWVTDDGIVVKAVLDTGTSGGSRQVHFEITELERESQPESLFEVPEGHRKMNIPGGG